MIEQPSDIFDVLLSGLERDVAGTLPVSSEETLSPTGQGESLIIWHGQRAFRVTVESWHEPEK
jgi:hypothetical protein